MPRSYIALTTHAVFSTKDRTPQIDAALEQRLFPYLGGVVRELQGKLLNINGGEDHVHILVSTPATLSVAELLRKVKGCSSKWINDSFPEHAGFEWQKGYGAFSVSQSQLSAVSRYIDRQKEHHRSRSFRDEFLRLLTRHGISVDERYLWT